MNGVCDNPKCGHAMETHFEDREDAPDGRTGPRFRGCCLGAQCACKRYVDPELKLKLYDPVTLKIDVKIDVAVHWIECTIP